MDYLILLILVFPNVLSYSIDRLDNKNDGILIERDHAVNHNKFESSNIHQVFREKRHIISMEPFRLLIDLNEQSEDQDFVEGVEDCTKMYREEPILLPKNKLTTDVKRCIGPKGCRDARTPLNKFYYCRNHRKMEFSGSDHILVPNGCKCGFGNL